VLGKQQKYSFRH